MLPSSQWAASATGRVEPKDGEVRIASQVPGRIVEVLAKTNDKVQAGDLLLRLDDQDIYVKIAAAVAEVGVRVREREEEKVTGLALERRNAEDAVADAERALFAARESFDALCVQLKSDGGNADAVASRARAKSTPQRPSLTAARGYIATRQCQAEHAAISSGLNRRWPRRALNCRPLKSRLSARACGPRPMAPCST